jgi:hypothetical protein
MQVFPAAKKLLSQWRPLSCCVVSVLRHFEVFFSFFLSSGLLPQEVPLNHHPPKTLKTMTDTGLKRVYRCQHQCNVIMSTILVVICTTGAFVLLKRNATQIAHHMTLFVGVITPVDPLYCILDS